MQLKIANLALLMLAGFCVSAIALAAETSAEAELNSVIELYRSEGAEQALPNFERLHVVFVESDDRINAARSGRYIGESHWRMGNYPQSREYLDSALAEFRELRERLEEGKTLNVLGLLEWDLGNYDQAIADFGQASLIGEELGDKRLAGSTMNNLSLVYDELGDYQTSLKQYQQALDLYRGADFPRGESDTLGNIGGVNLLLGRYQDALGYYQRALVISESLESKPSMSLDHGNLALCYLGLGQVDAALEHFDLAIALAAETGMRKEEALWLRGKGNALIRKGQYDLGLESHRVALATYEEIEARGLLLNALHDMGSLHLILGDPVSAEQYFQRAIALAREIGQAQAITAGLLALGDLHFSRERLEEANALYQQALQRAIESGELNYQVESLLRLSQLHIQQQKPNEAEAQARQALAMAQKTNAGFTIAEAWFAIAESARHAGDANAALANYRLAQTAAADSSDPDILWQIHYGIARVQVELGRPQEAIAELRSAVKIIESVRDRLQEDRFKAGYVQNKYQVYIDLVRLQLEIGMTEAALKTAERLRARSFLDQLENGGPVFRNEQQRQDEIALQERVRQLKKSLDEERSMPPPDRRQLAVDAFSSELMVAERDYQAFLDDTRSHSPLGHTANIPAMAEVQARLEPGAALVEYVVDAERVMIFVMQRDKLSAVIKDVRYADLYAKVNLLRELIQDPGSEGWWAPAASLSDVLIRPLQLEGLLHGIEHLYLVPHGILNYLPFAVLPVRSSLDDRVAMEQYTLTYLPAAAALTGEPRDSTPPHSLLALAPARSRLQYALEEARLIADLYRPASQLLSGKAATETAFKEQAGDYRVLHLSTHGYFNVKNPLLSGLELEPDELNDGYLEVHEILGLTLNASLVTLSACETGMGSGYFNEIPAGDEFVGLTRAFLLAGSQSVLATLWQVDDRSTVELMEGFYQGLEQPQGDHGQASALARVQRELRSSLQYRHPFYWAAFVLVGQQDQGANAFELVKRG